jgi:hypothetical protein
MQRPSLFAACRIYRSRFFFEDTSTRFLFHPGRYEIHECYCLLVYSYASDSFLRKKRGGKHLNFKNLPEALKTINKRMPQQVYDCHSEKIAKKSVLAI